MKTIGIKIGLGYLLALLMFLTIGIVSYITLVRLDESRTWVDHTNEVLVKIQEIDVHLVNAETGQRGFLITGAEKYLEPYNAAVETLRQDIATIRTLTRDNPNQQKRIDRLEPFVKSKLAELKETIDLRQNKGFEAALAVVMTDRGKRIMVDIRSVLAEMLDEEKSLLAKRQSRQTSDVVFARTIIVWGSGLAIVLLSFASVIITRNISRPLGQLTSVAEKISSGEVDFDVPVGNRLDEVGKLARSFHQMAEYLRQMAAGAQAIAAGKLDVDVTPRSERDSFGLSFVSMLESLRATASAADRIAEGDLTIEVKPRSDKDVLGIALSQMVVSLSGQLKELGEAASVLASAASEILAGVTQLTATSSESAVAVSQTSTTAEEVRQTSRLSNQKATYVSETSQKAVDVSESGRAATEATIRGMNHIKEQMEAIAETVINLSEQSQTIGSIITVVNDIAEQSNLLSVNASIEAAKAGEYGKGFTVVAQEIRKLADQSKQATAQVQGLLNDIQKATSAAVMATEQGSKLVNSGVEQSNTTREAIRQLGETIQESTQAAGQIVASSQQQMAGMDQIANAMTSIKEATSQSVASMQQVEVSARSLNELGQKMKDLIGKYKT